MDFTTWLAAILAALGIATGGQPAPAEPPATTTKTAATTTPVAATADPAPPQPTPGPDGVVEPLRPQGDSGKKIGVDKTAVWQFCTTNEETGQVFAWLRAWGTAPASGDYSVTATPLGSSAEGVELMRREHYQEGAPIYKHIRVDNKRQYNVAVVVPGQELPTVYRLPVDCRE